MRTTLSNRKAPRGIAAVRVLLAIIATVGATCVVAADCEVGNLTPPDEVLPDLFVGAETIALEYVAILTCPPTEPGFLPTVVHLQLQFDAEDVPASFPIRVRLGWTHGGPYYGVFWLPCEVTETISCVTPGVQEYAFAVSQLADCCGHLDNPHPPARNHYILGVEFPEPFPADKRPSAPTSNDDDIYFMIDRGDGWQYASEYGWVDGRCPIIWAEADYCDQPVPTVPQSWSAVRSLYR